MVVVYVIGAVLLGTTMLFVVPSRTSVIAGASMAVGGAATLLLGLARSCHSFACGLEETRTPLVLGGLVLTVAGLVLFAGGCHLSDNALQRRTFPTSAPGPPPPPSRGAEPTAEDAEKPSITSR
jgi:hypothetical protein